MNFYIHNNYIINICRAVTINSVKEFSAENNAETFSFVQASPSSSVYVYMYIYIYI